MKREVFVKQMARLMLHFKSDLDQLHLDAYWEEVHFIPGKAFVAGVTSVIRTREYPSFPTVGALLKAAVGDHGWVVPSRLQGRDVQLDDIVEAYRQRHQVMLEAQQARKALPPVDDNSLGETWEDKDKVIADLREEKYRLADDKRLLSYRLVNAEAIIQVQTEALKDYREHIRRQGEELARLERAQRVKI